MTELKKSHPVQTAEFAVTQEIDHEPAFNWWVKHVLKKRDRIVASIKKWQTRYIKKNHKFGMELPKNMEQALAPDAKNGNTLLADAVSKEMEKVRVAFEVLPDRKPVPIGSQFVQCHVVFDNKMDDFRCKARLVAVGSIPKAPATITYASIVSTDTVRIAFMVAALNDLEVKLGNICICTGTSYRKSVDHIGSRVQ